MLVVRAWDESTRDETSNSYYKFVWVLSSAKAAALKMSLSVQIKLFGFRTQADNM